jgi:hypothetical protein
MIGPAALAATVAEHWNRALRCRKEAEDLRLRAERAHTDEVRADWLRMAAEFEEAADLHEEFVAANLMNAGAAHFG